MTNSKLSAKIWRRGRTIITWEFEYIRHSSSSWWSTPGWYHRSGRGRFYRLTIDHDYPEKPMWLGFKKGKKWINAERLYEVIMVTHPSFVISSRAFWGAANRSNARRATTALVIAKRMEYILTDAYRGPKRISL